MFRRFFFRFAEWMQGRNGLDALGKALLALYLALWLIFNIVTLIVRSALVSRIFWLILTGLLAYILFRVFSRNIPRRAAENAWWENLYRRMQNRRQGQNHRGDYRSYADVRYTEVKPKKPKSTKEYKIVTCKKCGAHLRLKRRRGRHTAACPKCGADVKVFSFYE